ncbi:MAG TPA: TetR/AcrR family transcriptional regulator, partial [Micromonosporaceae bacterium]
WGRMETIMSGKERVVSVESILEIAARIFAERGYLGTNLQDVAAELGVTRQALYYHFSKKHDILRAVFEWMFRELNAAADVAEARANGRGTFENLLRGHVEFLAVHPHLAQLSVQEYRHLPSDMAQEVLELRRQYLERFYEAFAAGVEVGRLVDQDPRVAVQLAMGAANWLHRWYRPSGELSPSDMTNVAVQLLMGGFARAEGPAERRIAAPSTGVKPSKGRRSRSAPAR